MKLDQLIKQRVGSYKYPTLNRIKVGRVINVVAALPIGTSWLHIIGIPLSMRISPSVWLKGKINMRNGNGDLKWI